MTKIKCYMKDVKNAAKRDGDEAFSDAINAAMRFYLTSVVVACGTIPNADLPFLLAALKIAHDVNWENLSEPEKELVHQLADPNAYGVIPQSEEANK